MPSYDQAMGTGFLYLLLGLAIMAAVVITLRITLYWIIRTTVAGGSRDAQIAEALRRA